jgi:hypothetical protein
MVPDAIPDAVRVDELSTARRNSLMWTGRVWQRHGVA